MSFRTAAVATLIAGGIAGCSNAEQPNPGPNVPSVTSEAPQSVRDAHIIEGPEIVGINSKWVETTAERCIISMMHVLDDQAGRVTVVGPADRNILGTSCKVGTQILRGEVSEEYPAKLQEEWQGVLDSIEEQKAHPTDHVTLRPHASGRVQRVSQEVQSYPADSCNATPDRTRIEQIGSVAFQGHEFQVGIVYGKGGGSLCNPGDTVLYQTPKAPSTAG